MKAREVKRKKLAAQFAEKRAAFKKAGEYNLLQTLPKNSCVVRQRNRCMLTGRPRGYMRQFGISRVTFREMVLFGKIQDMRKIQQPLDQ